jgi:hypothetical protein
MQSCPPEQLADNVCDLLLMDLSTNSQLNLPPNHFSSLPL